MAKDEQREGWRERRAQKKAEKQGEVEQQPDVTTPEAAGRLVYPPPEARQQPPAKPGIPPQPFAQPRPGPTMQPEPQAGVARPQAPPTQGPSQAPPPRVLPPELSEQPPQERPAPEPGVPAGPTPRPPAAEPAGPPRQWQQQPAGPTQPPLETQQAVQQPQPQRSQPEQPAPQQPQPEQPAPQQTQPEQPAPQAQQPPHQQAQQPMPQPQYPPPGYYWPPPWMPQPYGPPGYGYPPGYPPPPGMGQMPPGPGYPPSPEQTGPFPVFPPVMAQQGMPMPPEQMPYPLPTGIPPMPEMIRDEAEFRELTGEEVTHWRVDLKWVFGVVTALLLLATLTVAGLYRVTAPGKAKDILVPLVEGSTSVESLMQDNYRSLRSKARRRTGASFVIPDIGVAVVVKGSVINSLTSDELSNRVITQIEKQLYQSGYKGNLPMPRALGVGEERAKAVAATILSLMNKRTHNDLLWPLIVLAVLTVGFGALFVVFSRGWGKVMGVGIAFIAGSLFGSLLLRIGSEFIWAPSSSIFKGAANLALRTAGASMLTLFDVALGVGAAVLLVGVIGGAVSSKSRDRITPFSELKRPEQAVVGGPPVEPGLSRPLESREDVEEPETTSPR